MAEWVEGEESRRAASPGSGAPEKMSPLPSPAPGRGLFFPLSILVALQNINANNGHHLLSICYTLSTI